MIINQLLDYDLTLNSLDPIRAGDLLDQARSRLKGKCRSNCLILDVIEIKQRSKALMTVMSNDIYFNIKMLLLAKTYILWPEAVITDVKVTGITEEFNSVYVANKHVSAVLRPSDNYAIIQNNYLPIKVYAQRCNFNAKEISVMGDVFIPAKQNFVAKLEKEYVISADFVSVVSAVQDILRQNNNKRDDKLFSFFCKVLYAYQLEQYDNNAAALKKLGGQVVDIAGEDDAAQKAIRFKPGLYVLESRDHFTGKSGLYYYDDPAKYDWPADIKHINIEEYLMGNGQSSEGSVPAHGQNIIFMLIFYGNKVKILNDFMAIFHDKATITAHRNLFEYYMEQKKSI